MNDILESLSNIANTPFFWGALTSAVVWGMYIGSKRNHKMAGFRSSMAIILPFVGFMLVASIATAYEYTKTTGVVGWQSYNNSLRLIIFTIAYATGLYVGHMIVKQAIHSVIKDEPKDIQQKVLSKVI